MQPQSNILFKLKTLQYSSIPKTETFNKLRKMICTIIILRTLRISTIITINKNPVKIRILLLIIVTILRIFIYKISRRRWFPLIFYMLFLGGILVMFLILSTIIPNEKIKKSKVKIWEIILILRIIPFIIHQIRISNTTHIAYLQNFLQRSYNTIFCTRIIIFYFLIFTVTLAIEKNRLRTRI